MNVIIHTETINGNDVVAVTVVPEGDTRDLNVVAAQDLPAGVSYRITDSSNLPSDTEFRAAWTDANPGETVDVDMPKARTIQMDRIRKARDAKWEDFDSRYLAAQRDGADLSALDSERQSLKDIPNNAQAAVDSASDVIALKAAWPSSLND
jgi:hypothetical protein